jgi:hypothetical protein
MRWQLIGTWLIGSLVMGTVAVLLTAGGDYRPFTPLVLLSAGGLLLLLFLVVVLFFALYVLGWRTQEVTWLGGDPRAAMLWPVLVGGGGLVGWGFAAVVTFESGYSLTAQLLLAYLGGGLPFTLVAAMLTRPVRVNLAAAMLTVIAVLTGMVMVPMPIQACVSYLQLLLGPVATAR